MNLPLFYAGANVSQADHENYPYYVKSTDRLGLEDKHLGFWSGRVLGCLGVVFA